MKTFLRFLEAPVVVEGRETYYPDSDLPTEGEFDYILPARRADLWRVIIDNIEGFPVETFKIALIEELFDGTYQIVEDSVAVFVAPYSTTQLYAEITIPSNVADGCYRLLLDAPEGVPVYSEWEEVGRTCEVENGIKTGYSVIEEERQVTYPGNATALRVSNLIKVGAFPDSSLLSYRNNTNAFGFDYQSNQSFTQQIRLEIDLIRPQHTISKASYRQTNDVWRNGNVRVGKKYTLITDYFDEQTHDALIAALNHSEVAIDGKYIYLSDAEPEPVFLDSLLTRSRAHEAWQISFEVFEQGYNQQNTGCGNDTLSPDFTESYDDGIFENIFE